MKTLISFAACILLAIDVESLQCTNGVGVEMPNVINQSYYQDETCLETAGDQQCFIGQMSFMLFTVPTKVSYGGCIGKAVSSSVTCEAILDKDTALNVDTLYPALISSVTKFTDQFAAEAGKNAVLLATNNTGPYAIDMVATLNQAFGATGWSVDEKLYPLVEKLPEIVFGSGSGQSYPKFIAALNQVDTEDLAIGNQLRQFIMLNGLPLVSDDNAGLVDLLPVAAGIFFYKTKEDFLKNAQPIFNMLEKLNLTDPYAPNFAIYEMMYHYMGQLWTSDQLQVMSAAMCPPSTTTSQLDLEIQKKICDLLAIDYKAMFTQLSTLFGKADIKNEDSIKALYSYPLSVYFDLTTDQQTALTNVLTNALTNPLDLETNINLMDVAFDAIVPQSGQDLYVELQRLTSLDEVTGMLPKYGMISAELIELASLSTYLDSTYEKLTKVMKKVDYNSFNFTSAVQEFNVLYADDFATIEAFLKLKNGDIQGILDAVAEGIAKVQNFSDSAALAQLPMDIIDGLDGILSTESTAALKNALIALYSGENAETVTGYINEYFKTMLPDIPKSFMEKLSALLSSSGVESYQSGLQGVYVSLFQLYMQNETSTVEFLNYNLPRWGEILDGFGGNVFSPNYVTLKAAVNAQYPEIATSATVQTILDTLPEAYPLLISWGNFSDVLLGVKAITDRINPGNEHATALGGAVLLYYDAMTAINPQFMIPTEFNFLVQFSFQIPYLFAELVPEGTAREQYITGLNMQMDLQRINYQLQTAFYKAMSNPYSVDMTTKMNTYFSEYESILGITGVLTPYTEPATAVATRFSRIDFTQPTVTNQMLTLLKEASDNYKVSFPSDKFPDAFSGLMDLFIKLTNGQITNLEGMFDDLYVVVEDFAAALNITEDSIADIFSVALPQFAPFWDIFSNLSAEKKKSNLYFLVNATLDAIYRPETLQSNIEEFVKNLLGNIDVKQEIVTILGTSECKIEFCENGDGCNTDEALDNAPTYTVPTPDEVTDQSHGSPTQPPDNVSTTGGSSTTTFSILSMVISIIVSRLL